MQERKQAGEDTRTQKLARIRYIRFSYPTQNDLAENAEESKGCTGEDGLGSQSDEKSEYVTSSP